MTCYLILLAAPPVPLLTIAKRKTGKKRRKKIKRKIKSHKDNTINVASAVF